MSEKKKNAIPKGGRGRPVYSEEHATQAYKLSLLGLVDTELAQFFDVSERTINNWKKKHPEFDSALKRGKAVADSNVATKLYTRAIGYEYDEVTIEQIPSRGDSPSRLKKKTTTKHIPSRLKKKTTTKHIPASETAMIFWLKNRRPDLWRDRREITGKDGADLVKVPEIDVNKLSDEQRKLLLSIGETVLNEKEN